MAGGKGSWFILTLMVGVFLWAGCERKSDDIPTQAEAPDVSGLLTKGWDYYLSGDYALAIAKFDSALGRDVATTDAYLGLGWSYTQMGQFEEARSKLTFIFAQPAWADSQVRADVYAGFAAGYVAEGQDSLAIIAAQDALDADPEWSFSHDATLTYYDLHLLQAQASFNSYRYLKAKEKVDHLEPGWSLAFPTSAASATITQLSVALDSTWASFRLKKAGASEIGSVVSKTAVASVPAAGEDNVGDGEFSEVTAGEAAKTEYWVVRCKRKVQNGGVFEVVGSVSGPQTDYDITTGNYTSDGGEISITIEDGKEDFTVGDLFTFATTAANTPLTVDQVKEGNRVFISGTKFFQDVSYEILVDYSYFNDFGDFLLQLMEKINSLY